MGTLADLAPWLDAYEHTIDDTFADKVVLPGFIDPHLHPFLPAVLSQMPFIAPDPWSLPVGDYPGATTPEEYWALLEQRFAAHDPSDGPFFSWGYHPLFHGPITRSDLDSRLSAEVPVVLWHRSFHELFFNTPALAWANIDGPDSLPELPEVRAHEIKGESIFAYVVCRGARPTGAEAEKLSAELRDFVGQELGAIAKPDDIRFADNLPKTRSGKIMRRLLRAIARDEEITQDISTLENPAIVEQLRGRA